MTITITNGTYTSQVQYEHAYERLANYADIPNKVIGPFSSVGLALLEIVDEGYEPLTDIIQTFARKDTENWMMTGENMQETTPVICKLSKLTNPNTNRSTYTCMKSFVIDNSGPSLRDYDNSTDGDIYVVLAKAN